jgi:hypothetical protein
LIHPETIKVVPHTFKDKNERLLEKEWIKLLGFL